MDSGMATLARTYEQDVGNSERDFLKFCPQGVRSKARMKFKFKFLKISTMGCKDIQ
jgi:hypothetical protein